MPQWVVDVARRVSNQHIFLCYFFPIWFCGHYDRILKAWAIHLIIRQVLSMLTSNHWKFEQHIILLFILHRRPWASYQIRKIAGCACAGNAGNVFPRRRFQRKPLVSDPGMHHGTCVTHVPWCMSGSRTRGGGENVPGIPGACAPAISRIWQEAHDIVITRTHFPHYGPFGRKIYRP